MEQEAGRVVARGIRTEELDVKHVGQPGQGMPVCDGPRREGPRDRSRRQTREDLRVLVHVEVVVEPDETISKGTGPDDEDRECEQRTDGEITRRGLAGCAVFLDPSRPSSSWL